MCNSLDINIVKRVAYIIDINTLFIIFNFVFLSLHLIIY